MINSQKLYNIGIDYKAGLNRFLNNPAFYETVLTAFINDTTFDQLEKAFLSNNMKEVEQSVHAIKGSSGNADLIPLYETANELLLILRSCNDNTEELQKKYENFCATYILVRDGIRGALGK